MKIDETFLTELEAKAKAATPGDWYHLVIDMNAPENDDFMEAAQPAHVLALIAELREARQTIARLRENAVIAFEDGQRR